MEDEGKLMDLLLRPVDGSDPQRAVLGRDLEERMEHLTPRRGEDTAEQAAAWLAERPVVSKRQGRRRMLTLLGLAAVLGFFCTAFEFNNLVPVLADLPSAPPWLVREAQLRLYSLPPEEIPNESSFLSRGSGEEDGSRNAWLARPEDPVLYYAYTHRAPWSSQALPEGYAKTWREIDPDNGVWALHEADSLLAGTSAPAGPGLDRALELVREAAAKPRLSSYRREWMDYLEAHRRPVRTAVQFLYWQGQQTSLWYSFQPAGDGLSDELERQLKRLPADAPEAVAYRKVLQWIGAEAGGSPVSLRQASARLGVRPLMWMLSRWGILGAAGAFVVGAGLAGLRLLPARGVPGKLTACLAQLRRPRDLPALLAWGLPAPLALGVASFPAANPELSAGILLLCVPVLMLLAMLTLMVVRADRMVSRQTGFLGFASAPVPRWLGILAAFLALADLLATGLMLLAQRNGSLAPDLPPDVLLLICGVPAGLVMLWIMVKVLLGYASPEASVRHRLIAARLIPAFLTAAILLGLISLVVHPLERAAVRQAVQEMTGGG